MQLILPHGKLLDEAKSLEDAGLQHGDTVTAVVQRPKLAATHAAFAIWCPGSGVVTWGHPNFGGDSSDVQDQLKHVREIQASRSAFAAVLADGSIVAWGNAREGGDMSVSIREQLRDVQELQASDGAFAARLADGSVVTWGSPRCGGDCSHLIFTEEQ